MFLTDKQCAQYDYIPTGEVEMDLIITQREVDQLQSEVDALRGDMMGNRIEIYMREGKISQRSTFISKLTSIISYRIKTKT